MANDGRVVTTNMPNDLVARMDEIASRIERSKSWIVREAVRSWVDEWQRRFELAVEALKDLDEGRALTEEEVARHVAVRQKARTSELS